MLAGGFAWDTSVVPVGLRGRGPSGAELSGTRARTEQNWEVLIV